MSKDIEEINKNIKKRNNSRFSSTQVNNPNSTQSQKVNNICTRLYENDKTKKND